MPLDELVATTHSPARASRSSSIAEHLADLARLALPMIVSRAGLAAMGIADAVMVSRFSPSEFASLSLADGTLGRVVDVFAAFILGGLVLVPRAFGARDLAGAFSVWRRSLGPAVGLGLLGCLIGLMGSNIFRWLGQSEPLASEAGRLAAILGLGYVAALAAISSAVFLEGIKRPMIVAVSVVSANLLNVGLNWMLIGGHAGLPALGARGSAISTTIVRCALAIVLVTFAWRARVRDDITILQTGSVRSQYQLGLAAAIVQAIMLTLTSSLLLFAGWLGAIPLAVLSALWTLNGPAILIALGVADATGIRIATADGRRGIRSAEVVADSPRPILALSSVAVASVLLLCVGAWFLFPNRLANLFTSDIQMLSGLVPLIPLASFLLLLDGISFVMLSALRALRDIAWPTGIEVATMAALVPLAAWLAFRLSEGVRGLLVAAIASALCRLALLLWRFVWVTSAARIQTT